MLTLVPSIWRRCHVGHDVAALREQSLGHVVVALKGSVPQSYQRAEDSKILGGPVSIPVSTVLAKSKRPVVFLIFIQCECAFRTDFWPVESRKQDESIGAFHFRIRSVLAEKWNYGGNGAG